MNTTMNLEEIKKTVEAAVKRGWVSFPRAVGLNLDRATEQNTEQKPKPFSAWIACPDCGVSVPVIEDRGVRFYQNHRPTTTPGGGFCPRGMTPIAA